MAKIKIVIGSSYGDEGKGLMTDYFATEANKRKESCLVVLSNGGSQRGHTVETPDGVCHVFHHFGSGTFAGADTYFPEYFIINPMEFRREHEELSKLGFNPKSFVSHICKVTTPFDMIANQIIEENRGKNRHGSCGMGVWETELRYLINEWEKVYWSYRNMILCEREDHVKYELLEIKEYYEERFKLNDITMSNKWRKIWDCDGLIEHYIDDVKFFVANTTMKGSLTAALSEYKNIIFENAQGLCLDQNFSDDERYTTPSNTGLKNPYEMITKYLDQDDDADVEVCYVTRTHATRHGAGPFPGECNKSEINPNMVDLTNVPNPFQGTLRYGKLNPEALMDRINKDFAISKWSWKKSLAITHINEYPWEFPELYRRFDNVYESDGMTREDIIRRQSVF